MPPLAGSHDPGGSLVPWLKVPIRCGGIATQRPRIARNPRPSSFSSQLDEARRQTLATSPKESAAPIHSGRESTSNVAAPSRAKQIAERDRCRRGRCRGTR